jgi:hypothetical protein
MSWGGPRAGDYVRPASDRRSERRFLQVVVRGPEDVMVEDSHPLRLGFWLAQEQNAKRQFAEHLERLATELASRNKRDLSGELLEAGPRVAEGKAPSLKLEPEVSLQTLRDLRRLGAGLRGQLAHELVEELRGCGFPAESGAEEPALSFLTLKAPLLWEMLYEGKQTDSLDWQRFWGFRVPITHWMNGQPRTIEDICLRHGLFAAVSEDLAFTHREVEALARRIEGQISGLRYGSLAEALCERVRGELASGHEEPREPGLLGRHLGGMSAGDRSDWKSRALVEVFLMVRSGYDLIHFACHCAPSEETELLSSLVMNVAGEAFCLDKALLDSDLRLRRDEWSQWRAGPLVFLNACGTTRQNRTTEPPGFPESWIKYGASAVIATLCPVPDSFAHAFAVKFYEFLLQGLGPPSATEVDRPDAGRSHFLAEALLATRRYFMEEYNNPLGLAYVLYARKGMRVLSVGR